MAEWKRSRAEDGRNTILLIGVLLVLIVLVGGGLLYIITQKGGKPETPPVQNETPKPPQPNITNLTNVTNVTPPCDDSCLLSRAVSAGNVSGCGQLSAEQLRQDCYGQLSGSYLDACKLVQDAAKRESCITSFAVSGKNISLCDLLADKADCRKAVDACADSAEPVLCRALQAGDPSKCGSSQSCLFDYASAKNDSSACSLIQNAVVSVFNRHFNLGELEPVVSRFKAGVAVEVGESVPSDQYVRLAQQIEGLATAVQKVAPGSQACETAAAVEFILEGLHLNKRLNKDRVGGKIQYRG
jgi:hypothetical protein